MATSPPFIVTGTKGTGKAPVMAGATGSPAWEDVATQAELDAHAASAAPHSSTGDLTLASDSDASGSGDLIFKSGGVERGRIDAAGTITGLAAADQVPTISELVAGCFSAASNFTISASVVAFSAPFACNIVQAQLVIWNTAVAASDTDYWTVQVRRWRTGVGGGAVVIAEKTTKVTGGQAIVQRLDWNFDASAFDPTYKLLQKGDVIDFAFLMTGSPTSLNGPFVQLRYEPV